MSNSLEEYKQLLSYLFLCFFSVQMNWLTKELKKIVKKKKQEKRERERGIWKKNEMKCRGSTSGSLLED